MSRMDSTAAAALDAEVIRPVFFVYLDVIDDPVRVCTAGRNITLTGTGDDDLDGHVFDGLTANFIDIGPVEAKDGGAGTVTASLSGLPAIDEDLLDAIADKAKWQGRTARLWRMIRDAIGAQQGAIQHYYTGYMVGLSIQGEPGGTQAVQMRIESYLAAFSNASNRTYLDQETFDPGDLSAQAAVALANGVTGNPTVNNTPISVGVARRNAMLDIGEVLE